MRVRINDAGNVFFFAAREEEAEQLLRSGLAKPQGKGKKIRCLQLQCSRKAAHTFLRGGRWSTSQASKTFKLGRVGPRRLPCYEHLERSFSFGSTESLPIITRPPELPKADVDYTSSPEPKPDGVLVTVTETPDEGSVEPVLQFIPNERGIAEKEPERAIVEPTALNVLVEDEQRHDSTVPSDPNDMSGLRRLAASVILQAIEDKATHWFSASYSRQAFEFWCSVGGLDPGQVRQKAMAAVKNGKVINAIEHR